MDLIEFNELSRAYAREMRKTMTVRDDSIEGLTAEAALASEMLEFLSAGADMPDMPAEWKEQIGREIGILTEVLHHVQTALACRYAAEQQVAGLGSVVTIH